MLKSSGKRGFSDQEFHLMNDIMEIKKEGGKVMYRNNENVISSIEQLIQYLVHKEINYQI